MKRFFNSWLGAIEGRDWGRMIEKERGWVGRMMASEVASEQGVRIDRKWNYIKIVWEFEKPIIK